MATDPRYGTARGDGHNGHRVMEDLAVAEDHEGWLARSRVVLTPIAAPSIMGLFGFAMATVMLGAYQAGWYGNAATPLVIWPLALFAGGIMQGIAAIASLRARDGVAVAVHTAWASFWVGWGILQLLVATHVMAAVPLGAASPSFAMWFVVLTLVTFWGALGALAQNMLVFVTLGVLTAASAVTAAGTWAGSLGTVNAGGWLYVISAAAAWLAAGAMVLEHSYGRSIIPVGRWSKRANIPGAKVTDPIAYPAGMPGLKVGQ
jgi:uncharacterized protein